MKTANQFAVSRSWKIILADLGLSPANLLRRAGLAEDLFVREHAALDTAAYFRLWRALETETADPLLPLHIGRSISVEAFDPPIFAALCSRDLETALHRIAHFKRLICPMALTWQPTATGHRLTIAWLDQSEEPPSSLVAMELVFFVQLARLATRERICPVSVQTPVRLHPAEAYTSFFGKPVSGGDHHALVFSRDDVKRPFLTADAAMWQWFEPALQKRLSALDAEATTSERVRAALLELLPSGDASVDTVAAKLGMSTRSLQRKLKVERITLQKLRNRTREELARHYLKDPALSPAEISFLLGFQDPNSFFRAFHAWTGETPSQTRAAMVH